MRQPARHIAKYLIITDPRLTFACIVLRRANAVLTLAGVSHNEPGTRLSIQYPKKSLSRTKEAPHPADRNLPL